MTGQEFQEKLLSLGLNKESVSKIYKLWTKPVFGIDDLYRIILETTMASKHIKKP